MSNENQLKTVNVPLFVQEAINHVSGEYAAQFWDGIYDMSGNPEAVENIGEVIGALHLESRDKEAMLLIHALYDLMGVVYPIEIAIIEEHEEAKKIFIDEFLLDLEDLMYDYNAK